MKVYESEEKDIDLPNLDLLTFLFGEFTAGRCALPGN